MRCIYANLRLKAWVAAGLVALAIPALVQAYCVPVIREIPSPIITNDTLVSGSAVYVYPDAFSLQSFSGGSCDGNDADVIWSFTSLSNRYLLNGAMPLSGGDNRATPPANKIINSATTISNSGEIDPDNNTLTVTFRDQILSPLGGPTMPSNQAPGSVIAFDLITLFGSNGTTSSTGRSFIAYTVEAGPADAGDRLSSTPVPPPASVANFNFATGTNGWTSSDSIGSVTYGTAGGLCISVTNTGDNLGEWISPYSVIPLVDNSVWRIRATMTTNQTTAGSVPLWDIYMQNYGDAGQTSKQAYEGDYFVLDNTGSASAIKGPAQGLNTFDFWYTPAQVRTPQWRSTSTGAFAAANDAGNDMRLVFRILDSDSAGINGAADSGQICMTNLIIDRFDLANEYSMTDVYNLNPIVPGLNGVSVDDFDDLNDSTVKDFATAPLTLSPADPINGWGGPTGGGITAITPGDTLNPPASDPFYGTGASTVDNYPVVEESNVLYELVVEASVPNALAESSPPDAIRLGIDTKTIEYFADSYALSGIQGSPAMPKQTSTVSGTQLYSMFFWSHHTTLATVSEAARLRYRVEILNAPLYTNANGNPHNLGGVRIHSIKMRRVKFYGDGQT